MIKAAVGRRVGLVLLFVGVVVSCPAALGGQPDPFTYDVEFFPNVKHDPAITSPSEVLGFELGAWPARHAQVEQCLKCWAEQSGRIRLQCYGHTHEGRALYYAIISSEGNVARLEPIRQQVARLADPRQLPDRQELERLIADTPAVAWMAYAIHGDELSSTDAALAAMHHLLADAAPDVQRMRHELIIIFDPLMNPDGRERFLNQIQQHRGQVPNLDVASLQHRGHWPRGRGNHYYFDMNRDWLAQTQPETRGRAAAIAQWNPQLLVDAHEMWPLDTYLFNPPREPFNPHLSPIIHKWWRRFADDQAHAFDAFGWSYYTREWLEFWYPGYTDAWVGYRGGVGMLYEQAGIGGQPVRTSAGGVMSYRQTVHHQLVSTMANLNTLLENRREILADFVEQRRQALSADNPAACRTFLMVPGPNHSRQRRLLSILSRQGIELQEAKASFVAEDVLDRFGQRHERLEFPLGTVVVSMRQPLGPLVGAILDFDPRMSDAFLAEERRELERKRRSRIYDVTAWNLPMAFDVEAYWADRPVEVVTEPLAISPPPQGGLTAMEARYGYVIDGVDDASSKAVAYLLQHEVAVRVGEKDFDAAGRAFGRGSYLLRKHENGPELVTHLQAAATTAGVNVFAVDSALATGEGPDLGGGHFKLLRRPRVAVLGQPPFSPSSYGSLWHLLDCELALEVSALDVLGLGEVDLRRYNVLILPNAWGQDALGRLLQPLADELKAWVQGGGTLIALSSSAGVLADEKLGLSAVRLRRDVLAKLAAYQAAVRRERDAGREPPDPTEVWQTPPASQPTTTQPATKPGPEDTEALAREDEWLRVFRPYGVILAAELNGDHWLTFGCGERLGVLFNGDWSLMSMHPVQTPVRLSDREHLRMSGLLWPEAAQRLATTAYATVEARGQGQIILFAGDPQFRGYFQAGTRLLINAILLGPGVGAQPPLPW